METIRTFHVRTRYLGPTNSRGARVKATTASGLAVTVSWDHALNSTENHEAAFRAMLAKSGNAVAGVVYANGGFDDGFAFMAPTCDAATA